MWHILWGLKTIAFFDVWSIEHTLTGMSIGHTVRKKNASVFKKIFGDKAEIFQVKYFDLVGVLFLAFAWETIEHYLEAGLAGDAVAFWFQGVEFWGNRIITDPLMMVIGYYIAKRFPKAVWPARAASLVWLLVHIFVFPHSMYLHELF